MKNILLAIAAAMIIAPMANSAEIQLTWEPGDTTELSHYTAYCGPNDQSTVDTKVSTFAGSDTSGIVSIDYVGTIYCAMTATDMFGAESTASEFATVVITGAPPAPSIINIERVGVINITINN